MEDNVQIHIPDSVRREIFFVLDDMHWTYALPCLNGLLQITYHRNDGIPGFKARACSLENVLKTHGPNAISKFID